MPRRLVVCRDGTWNEPDQRRGGKGEAVPTNVAKLALGVLTRGPSSQLMYYEPGVGTAPDDHIVGGVFGYGLSRNVCNAYRFLAHSFESGDQLYLFGFRRGAYTARSLAGLIRNCGILRRECADQVDEAFALYRDRTSRTHPRALASQIFREMYAHPDDEIHFIGVWDTVGALGIPTELPGWRWLSERVHGWERLWGFHGIQLSSHVRFAYHALAIDETREPFKPTMWTRDDAADGQTLEQVWFAGVHTEVGGGAEDASLSDIALLWMVEKAQACGLEVKPSRLAPRAPDGAGEPIDPKYDGPIVDLRKGVWKAARLPPTHPTGRAVSAGPVRGLERRAAPAPRDRPLLASGTPRLPGQPAADGGRRAVAHAPAGWLTTR
ncbi:MAG: DUF2235 domain-containing protein [Solirubrobacteraceae bacterium]